MFEKDEKTLVKAIGIILVFVLGDWLRPSLLRRLSQFLAIVSLVAL